MNVTQKNVTNVVRLKASFPKIGNHVLESRFRSRIEQGDAVIGFERGCGHDAGRPRLACFPLVNLHSAIISSKPPQWKRLLESRIHRLWRSAARISRSPTGLGATARVCGVSH